MIDKHRPAPNKQLIEAAQAYKEKFGDE